MTYEIPYSQDDTMLTVAKKLSQVSVFSFDELRDLVSDYIFITRSLRKEVPTVDDFQKRAIMAIDMSQKMVISLGMAWSAVMKIR